MVLFVVARFVKKQHTYALLSERVPNPKTLHHEEALAELAYRFFGSHGPATFEDFAWWSGLTKTDARHGLEVIKNRLIRDSINDTD